MVSRQQVVTTSRLWVVLGGALSTWAAGSAALLLAAQSSAMDLTAQGLAGLEGQLATAASVLGVVLLSWLTVAFVTSVLDLSRPGARRVPPRAAEAVGPWPSPGGAGRAGLKVPDGPRVVRRAAALVLGLSMAAVTAGPAGAAISPTSPTSPASSVSAPSAAASETPVVADSVGHTQPVDAQPVDAVPAGDGRPAPGTATWTPDRPAASVGRAVHPDIALVTAAPRLGAAIIEEVAVRRGDTLWSIAARHLGSGARADDVARSWPLWWQVNRSVIGEDPNLILPGQVLRDPSQPPD